MAGLLARIACLRGRHEPDRRKVKEVGSAKIGRCLHCGVALEKQLDGRWSAQRD